MIQAKQRRLSAQEIEALSHNGCRAEDWSKILVSDNFEASKIFNACFRGIVFIGEKASICNATLHDCIVGNGCEIRNIGNKISSYIIGDKAVVVDCGHIFSDGEKRQAFGIGHPVAVLNEGGGREVLLSEELNSNIAYMLAAHRYKEGLVEAINNIILEADAAASGTIGEGSRVVGCRTMENVVVRPNAIIEGATLLRNGTVKSTGYIGHDVVAQDFVVGEGARVDSGANVRSVFIGEGSIVADGFFAENCIICSNCQLLNGEAVAAFAGPFTVSHHKTSLLIAGMYSFFNAGSATNASNHHYRLGPTHQAIYQRGVKTGSGSYVFEPAHIGAYTMVVGQHKKNVDCSHFPFSYLVNIDGESQLLASQNLRTIGVFRDAQKWRKRDVRKGGNAAGDVITFDVFNPKTVGEMIRAIDELNGLAEKGTSDYIRCGGFTIRRAIISHAVKNYEEVVEAVVLSRYLKSGGSDAPCEGAFVDCGGAIVPANALFALEDDIVAGKYKSLVDIRNEIERLATANYDALYAAIAKERYKADELDRETVKQRAVDAWLSIEKSLVADAQKDFGANLAIGYGLDGTSEDAKREYELIKGKAEENKDIIACHAYCQEQINNLS